MTENSYSLCKVFIKNSPLNWEFYISKIRYVFPCTHIAVSICYYEMKKEETWLGRKPK